MSQIKIGTMKKLLFINGFNCTYCEKEIKEITDLTIDHVVPKFHGGGNKFKNLAVSCYKCNQQKGLLLLPDYLQKYNVKVTKRIEQFL